MNVYMHDVINGRLIKLLQVYSIDLHVKKSTKKFKTKYYLVVSQSGMQTKYMFPQYLLGSVVHDRLKPNDEDIERHLKDDKGIKTSEIVRKDKDVLLENEKDFKDLKFRMDERVAGNEKVVKVKLKKGMFPKG